MCSTKRLLFMFAITALCCNLNPALAQQYGWKVIAKPANSALNGVEFVDSSHGWCVGDGGSIFFTKDGGLTWRNSSRPSNPNVLFDLSFADTLYGWAIGTFAGGDGIIWRTTNGGASWSEQIFKSNRSYQSTSTQNTLRNTTAGSTRFGPDTGKVAQTNNGGGLWTERTIADSIQRLINMQFLNSTHGWISAGAKHVAGVLRTMDGGNSWKFSLSPGFAAISFIDTWRGWAVTISPPTHAYRTRDGGVTWQQLGHIYDPMWDDLHPAALSFVDSLNGWAFGSMFYRGISAEVIYRTSDGGKSWVQESVGLTGDLGYVNDAKMLDRFHGWAVCNDGSVLRYQLITEVVEKLPLLPKEFSLYQNYPNPFNATTQIEYEVTSRVIVDIAVHDALGKKIQQLVNSTHEPGIYHLRFDSSHLASGTYYYTMKAGAFSETKQMTLLK
jgi:photosystem II stability/assembly factor-like uncharacterized protein